MDPNENLREQLELAQKLRDDFSLDDLQVDRAAMRLAELVLALDEWLRKGGFYPRAWLR